MSYTVVGLFPDHQAAERASERLATSGFPKEDYSVSRYTSRGEYQGTEDYEEDERTSGFWGWLFGDNDADRKHYSNAASKSNVVTVYTDDVDRAEKARDIMNDNGAIDVSDFNKARYNSEEYVAPDNNKLTETERARIINKARNDLYFIDSERTYSPRHASGMTDEMDSLGNKDGLS